MYLIHVRPYVEPRVYHYEQLPVILGNELRFLCHHHTNSDDHIRAQTCKNKVYLYIKSRVHNKRREGEYPTLTIPCTNALRKVPSVNHRVLSFCINTLRETKGALIGVNSVVLSIVDTR